MRLEELELTQEAEADPELAVYRQRTIAMLKKYFRMSVELGHLPSVMGKEFFRSHVTGYGTHSFEDTAIFVLDVERCVESMHRRYQDVIATLFFQQYSNEEAAKVMGCGRTTLVRWRREALDVLTAMFLERQLLQKITKVSYERLKDEEPLSCDSSEEVPKKSARGVKQILAVAVLA
jgi:hypothetical protein